MTQFSEHSLQEYQLRIPLISSTEQQKIANYLSSLDDLITAQTQKIEALQTHKKGLLQQLFPHIQQWAHPQHLRH